MILLLWLGWQRVVPSGEWQARREFPGSSRRIGEPFPAGRIVEKVGVTLWQGQRTITVEPVYVNVRVPRPFASVGVTVHYLNPSQLPWRLGVREQVNEWRWSFSPWQNSSDRGQAEMIIPLNGVALDQGAYMFIFSAPGLNESVPPFVIESLEFNFHK